MKGRASAVKAHQKGDERKTRKGRNWAQVSSKGEWTEGEGGRKLGCLGDMGIDHQEIARTTLRYAVLCWEGRGPWGERRN